MPPIRRLFVLMLENRSYDNIFGWSDLQGQTPDGVPTRADGLRDKPQFFNIGTHGSPCNVSKKARYQLNADLGHEFPDVLVQMCGKPDAAMSNGQYPALAASANQLGFVYSLGSHAAEALCCFTPEQLPVLNFLASQFAVCDRWFASMPGPTWPNRFFALAGTSWGLDHSPSTMQTVGANLFDGARFGNGSDTLFTRLTPEEWLIAYGDTPQSWSLKGIERSPQRFLRHQELINALQNGQLDASFIFIEPTYDPIANFSNGQSMHPCGDVRKGEGLVATMYNAIRQSRYWEESVLLIVFDEHGGFFDHVIPDDTVVPAAQRLAPAQPTPLTQYGFRFDRYGFRVPAIVISPYVRAGTIDHTFYDHTAIAKTLASIVQRQKPPLLNTQRFANANDFWRVLTLREPRQDAYQCPPAAAAPNGAPAPIAPPSRSVAAFGTIDWQGRAFYGGA